MHGKEAMIDTSPLLRLLAELLVDQYLADQAREPETELAPTEDKEE